MQKLPQAQKEKSFIFMHANITEAIIAITRDPLFRSRLEAEQSATQLQ